MNLPKKLSVGIHDFFIMTLGVLMLTAGVYFFKIPNGFATGGVSGIGTILGKLIPSLSPSVTIAGLNFLLLLLGFAILGRDTGIKTVYCSMMFSLLTVVLEKVCPMDGPMTGQPLLELVYAMLLTAIGSALMFEVNASSGGTDIVAMILKKYSHINVGKCLLCVDALIASSSFFVYGVQTGLFSVLGLFAKAFLVDEVLESINSCKYFIVITSKAEVISEFIMQQLMHGVSTHPVTGEYTKNQLVMLHTVCRRSEAIRLRSRIREIDPDAFIIITTTSEIIGRGFRGVS